MAALQGRDCVYRTDVELDQIMAYFRIALANISGWFLRLCFERRSMSLAKLLHNILLMPAEIELTQDVRHIRLKRNRKDPECDRGGAQCAKHRPVPGQKVSA